MFVSACGPLSEHSIRAKRTIRTAEQLIALSKPSSAHKVLLKLEGDWSVTWRSSAPTRSAAELSGGFSHIRAVMDGRFIEEQFRGELDGRLFQGRNFIGFNNATGLYEGLWIDSLSTGMTISKGRFDPESGAIIFVGSVYNPGTGKTEYTRSKLVFSGEDSFSFFVKSEEDSKRGLVSLELHYDRIRSKKKSGKDTVEMKK